MAKSIGLLPPPVGQNLDEELIRYLEIQFKRLEERFQNLGVGTSDLVDNAVTTAKILDGTILSGDLDATFFASLSKGVLGRAYVTADQTITTVGSWVDLTSLSTTVTVAANRLIEIKGKFQVQKQGSAGYVVVGIWEGAAELDQWAQTLLVPYFATARPEITLQAPSAGVHTYKLAALNETTTGSIFQASGVNPGWIRVMDVGPAS